MSAEIRPARPRRAAPLPDPQGAPLRLVGWGLVAIAVALVHDRLWASPNLDAFSLIARDFGADPFSRATDSDYLLTNVSLPALARLTAMTEPHHYALLHLIVVVAGCGVGVVLAHRRFGYHTARTLLVLLAAAPGITVVLEWLGQPDALTFPIGIAMALVRRRGALVALAVLAGLTHPEQAIFLVAVAAAVRGLVLDAEDLAEVPAERPRWVEVPRRVVPDLLAGLAGVIVGRLATEAYLRAFDIGVGQTRSDFLDLGWALLAEHHGRAPLSLWYLLWGPLWVVVAGVVGLRIRARRGADERDGYAWSWAVLAVLAVAGLVPMLVTLDETRVYAMVTAPLIGAAAALLARELPEWRTGALTVASVALLTVTLVVPGGFTAGEDVWATEIPTGEFVDFLRTGDAPGPLFLWLLGPFDLVIPDLTG